jgi:hypothetical protein
MHSPTVPPPPPVPWWRENLYVGEYLYMRLGGSLALPGARPGVGIPPPKDPTVPWVPASILAYQPDSIPVVEEAYRVTQALIEAIRDEAVARGAKLAVVVHNAPWAHDDGRWRFMCMRHPVAMKTWDRQKPNRVIDAFLEAKQLPFLDLFHTFEAAKANEQLFFQHDPHWRPAGHRVAAQATAEFLRRGGLAE